MKHFDFSWLLCLALLTGCAAESTPLSTARSLPEAPRFLQPIEPDEMLRRPVAVACVDNDQVLLVANRRSGTISAIDINSRAVIGETVVGRQLADMAVAHDHETIVVVDEAANEVISVRWTGQAVETLARVSVDPSPVTVVLDATGRTAYIGNLWSHRITVVDVSRPDAISAGSVIDLPFAPRSQCLLPDGKHLAVTAAFGGRFCLVDLESESVAVSREWNAHNQRGIAMAANKKELLVAHQALMGDSPTTANGVHWGQVLMNLVRTVPLDTLFSESPPPGAFLGYLGTMDDAAGDPTGMLVTHDDRRIVAYAGTGEVGISTSGGGEFARVAVGQRPTALALDEENSLVFVANTFSDSVSVVDLASVEVVEEISLGPQSELSIVDRGEILFHDARLSSDGWFSCHSCHTDGHSNGFLNDNFGDETTGAPKRVLSLLGVADSAPWAWNGRVESLDEQVRKSILTTMRGPEPTDDQVQALVAYLERLQPPPPLPVARHTVDASLRDRGRVVFERSGCITCHDGSHFTSSETYEVGLTDQNGSSEFNPPSLRGVSQRNRLLHDNRAKNLRAVFEEHQHALEESLADDELAALIAYLESL
jgi:YVTN family beta-propeller protein